MNDSSIYVGNFPYSTTEQDLVELFSTLGPVTRSVVIIDHATGRSKGFGFVEFASPEIAIKAKETMDGQEYGGRPLRVNDATPRAAKPETNADAPAPAAMRAAAAAAAHPTAPRAAEPGVILDSDDEEHEPAPLEDTPAVSKGYHNSLLGV